MCAWPEHSTDVRPTSIDGILPRWSALGRVERSSPDLHVLMMHASWPARDSRCICSEKTGHAEVQSNAPQSPSANASAIHSEWPEGESLMTSGAQLRRWERPVSEATPGYDASDCTAESITESLHSRGGLTRE